MDKQEDWQVYGSTKVSDLNRDAELTIIRPSFSQEEIKESPELKYSFDYVYIKQNDFAYDDEKIYSFAKNDYSNLDVRDYYPDMDFEKMSQDEVKGLAAMAVPQKVNDLERIPILDDMSKETLFERLDSMGIDVTKVVERKEDLGDFISPVVYHQQEKEEKEIIRSEIKNMKPGDELTYTIRENNAEGEKVQKFHFAAIDKDHLIRLDMEPNNLTVKRKYVTDFVIDKTSFVKDGELNHHEDGWRPGITIPARNVLDIKINKGRFNTEELETLRKGKAIDYNKVFARKPIPDKEDYLQYIIERSNGNTVDAHNAFNETLRNPNLSNAEYCELAGKVHETERKAEMTRSPVAPAICILHETAYLVKTEGIEGQEMALACHVVANGLSQGKGWLLAAKKAEEEHPITKPYMDAIEMVRSHFLDMNIDKGIEDIVEKRETEWMKQVQKAREINTARPAIDTPVIQTIQPKTAEKGKGRL